MNHLKLTEPEANHLLSLIDQNEQEGSYWGNKEHWQKRSNIIKNKIKESFVKRNEVLASYKQKIIK